jgi:NitT/TauT family transport system substrate-binding protein
MKTKTAYTIFTIIIALSLVLTACGSINTPSAPVKINFAYDYWAGYYPGLIAIEKGYYKESNLDVKAIKPENTDSMMGDFLGGKYDFMAISMGDLINLTQRSDDFYFIIIADESAGADAVMATPDIQTIADLRGKSVGFNQGGFAEVFVMTVLKENGLGTGDVTVVDVDASEVPAKLRDGTIQAGETWEPYVTEAKKDGNVTLFTSKDTPGLVLDGIAVRGEFVRQHPEAVHAFVDGWFKAVDFWLANPQDGNAAAAKISGDDPAAISLEGIGLKTLADNQALFQPGTTTDSAYYTAQLFVDFFVKSGILTKRPDAQKLINADFVKP